MHNEIKAALIDLMAGIKAADGTVIVNAAARLDDLAEQHRTALDPQLVHFLERRSYDKALQFLGGATDIPAGICGGGRLKTGGK